MICSHSPGKHLEPGQAAAELAAAPARVAAPVVSGEPSCTARSPVVPAEGSPGRPDRRGVARRRIPLAGTPETTAQVGTPVALGTAAPSPTRATVKPYLYIEELADLTPWSVQAINTKVRRGELRRNVHYFQEHQRGRLIFKWDAIVQAIEGAALRAAASREESRRDSEPIPRGKAMDIEKAKAELQRLLD